MFIEVVRRHIETMPPQRAGWLAGLRASRRWQGARPAARRAGPSLDDAGVGGERQRFSRSALYDHFTDLVGAPPLRYLAQWRNANRDRHCPGASDVGMAEIAAKNRLRLGGRVQPRLPQYDRRAAVGLGASER